MAHNLAVQGTKVCYIDAKRVTENQRRAALRFTSKWTTFKFRIVVRTSHTSDCNWAGPNNLHTNKSERLLLYCLDLTLKMQFYLKKNMIVSLYRRPLLNFLWITGMYSNAAFNQTLNLIDLLAMYHRFMSGLKSNFCSATVTPNFNFMKNLK